MDVENHIYARKDIKQLGIAPMTSMFNCATTSAGCATPSTRKFTTPTASPCGSVTASGSAGR